MLLTTPGLGACISGVILFDETIRQNLSDGTAFMQSTEAVLRSVFEQLARQGVMLEALILKPNMVVAGLGCAAQNTPDEVAGATLQCLLRVVPAAVPGITFLSGGQTGEQPSSRLNAMHAGRRLPAAPGSRPERPALPWQLTFSFSRAL